MVYRLPQSSMSGPPAPKKLKSSSEDQGGLTRFSKMGEEFIRLKEFLLAKGEEMMDVTAGSLVREDPWFACYKTNSLKGNISSLKKELSQRSAIEAGHRK